MAPPPRHGSAAPLCHPCLAAIPLPSPISSSTHNPERQQPRRRCAQRLSISGGTLSIRATDNVNMGGILFNGSNTISSNLIFDPTSASAPGTGTIAEALVYLKETKRHGN